MTAIAWFSPWPPARGDAAHRSAIVVPALRRRGLEVDVISSAADSIPRPLGAYDLAVHHLADAPEHDFVWPHVFQQPGLTVLHEGRLHRSRARTLLSAARATEYRAEFAWNHPHVAPAIAELAVAGHVGPYGVQWPMIAAAIAASRLTATHAAAAVPLLHAEQPDHAIDYIPASDGSSAPIRDDSGLRQRLRAALGWPPDTVVIGVFAPLGEAWRVPQILKAIAAVRARIPNVRVLLAGPSDGDLDLLELLQSLALTDIARRLDDGAELDAAAGSLDAAIAATDVVMALHWPAALDLPGVWLRALAAGRAAVILDLMHLSDVPTLDPRTWKRHAPADRSVASDGQAVSVAIDVMDEDHSLRLALQRLGADADLRARLGRAGRAYWERAHSPEQMIEGYARAIRRAMALPRPDARMLPRHLQPS